MNHFEAVLPQTRFAFNSQVPNSTPKSQSFDHLVSDSGSKEMPVYDDYGDSDGNGRFDDVLAGFGNKGRPKPESRWSFKSIGKTSKTSQDSDAVFTSTSPHVASGSRKANGTSVSSDGARSFGDLDPFGSFGKSVGSFSSLKADTGNEGSPIRTQGSSEHPTYSSKETTERFSGRSPGGHSGRKLSSENNRGSPRSFFKMPSVFTSSRKSSRQDASSPTSSQVKSSDKSAHVDTPPWCQKIVESPDDVWLTVSEVPLFTQPTRAPPPSRPPPPPPVPFSKTRGSSVKSSSDMKILKFSSLRDLNGHSGDHNSVPITARSSTELGVDESRRVAMGRSKSTSNNIPCDEVGMQPDMAASATTAKEAMDRAETRFQHAKGMKERESKDSAVVEKEESRQDAGEKSSGREQERLEQGQKDKEEVEQWKLEKERERKEKENEQRRLEKERERARQAVERATREARERAAAEARLKAEKAAREKANAEARRLAERAAVQRAQAEARERAAALAKERAEKAAAEAREQEAREKAFEAQMKEEKAAVERAAAEAREKSAAEAREKVAAAAKAPKFSSKQSAEVAKASAATVSRLREASSVANSVDDLYSVFDGLTSTQEFEGESEERQRARLERQQRTQERAARALAEKNQRDLQAQREQEERQRIAETLDTEIKRWAAGKEGNLRALLATLHYVLWPECGWQPVSLTDLMTGASVKKVYRKATLCIHPDKVQQKGANLQQKYIAGKVFDLLKEAWNKFNSEELF